MRIQGLASKKTIFFNVDLTHQKIDGYVNRFPVVFTRGTTVAKKHGEIALEGMNQQPQSYSFKRRRFSV